MKRIWTLLIGAMLGSTLSAAVIIQQNFDDTELFKTSGQPVETGCADSDGGQWSGFRPDFSVVNAGASGNQALQISRLKIGPSFDAVRNITIPENREITLKFDFKAATGNTNSFGVRLYNQASGKEVLHLQFCEDHGLRDRYGNKVNFKLVPGKWQTLTVKLVPDNPRVNISLKTENGEFFTSNQLPLVKFMPVDKINFYHQPGMNEAVLIDNVKLFYEDYNTLYRRENLAIGRKTTVTDRQGERNSARLVDGICDAASLEVINGIPSEILIDFGKEYTISTVRLHSGASSQYGNPSGCTSVTKYKVDVFSTAAGKWREMAVVENAPVVKSRDEDDTARFSQVDFPPIEATQAKITILESSDTGKRADRVIDFKAAVVREVEVFSHAKGDGVTGLGKVLQAEFFLPVYRDQKTAQLYAELDDSMDNLPIEISFRDRNNGLVPAEPMQYTLKPGKNIVPVDITGWPSGEYRSLIKGAGSNPRARGEFGRLLRIDRFSSPALPLNSDWTGKRLYFPDQRFLAQHENIATKVCKPEVQFIGKTRISGPQYVVQVAGEIYFTQDGKLCQRITEMDREWKNPKYTYMVTTPGEWNWEIAPERPEADPAFAKCEFYENSQPPAAGFPSNTKVFKMYDAERDGKVDIKQLRLIYTGYAPKDLGILKAPAQTTWLVWVKSPNEYLLLRDTPFLRDGISGKEAEDPDSTNDNFAGQYLSEDGQTFIYVRGHTVKRYAPVIARYDNLWMASRMLTVFSTKDGFNWKRNYFAIPDENDFPTMQHYGAGIHRAPRGNGLMLGFVDNYSALHQHYDIELVYSWDGINWERFPGHENWIKAGPPGSWTFGWTNLHKESAERDGKIYQQIGVASPLPHYAYEVSYVYGADENLNGDLVRQKFERRNITSWPYWSCFGSYDKLADYLREQALSCGVAVSRLNGWFGIHAENTGSFTTLPMRGSGKLAANFQTEKDGYIQLEIIDKTGKVLRQAKLTGDAICQEIFDTLPQGDFQIRAVMHKAIIYTLDFI